jgi:hypothetical protein
VVLPTASPAAATPAPRRSASAAPVVRARLASSTATADPSPAVRPPPDLLLDPMRSLEPLPLLLAMLVAAGMALVLAREAQRGRRH